MRDIDQGVLTLLADRRGLIARRLIWIEARNTATNAVEALGLWDGDYHLSVTLGGGPRLYIGVGAVLPPEPITSGKGLAVRMHRVILSAIHPDVENLVKGYNTRFAPVEIHRAIFDPATREMVGPPSRVFRGTVNTIDFPKGGQGEGQGCIVELASETRQLTRALATKKSDGSHKARGGDRFRRFAEISGSIPVYWGEARAIPDQAPATTAPAGEK